MKNIGVIIILFSISCIVRAQSILDIGKNEFPLGNFENLDDLKEELKDVRVIGLGESNHSMGTTFEAKVAMIKFLCDSLGFNTIAFEAGIYDCHKTNELFNLGTATRDDFYNSIFQLWKCEEVDPLYDYIVKTKTSHKSLEFIGVDNQFLDQSDKYLIEDYLTLEDSLRNYSENFALSERFYTILREEIKYSNYFKKFTPEDTLYFCKNIDLVDSIIKANHLDSLSFYKFWTIMNLNLKTDYVRRYYKPSGNLRDSIMSENILYYLDANPNAKIIVWAATYHLLYNIESLKSKHYVDSKTAGNYLKSKLDKQYYCMSFTAFSGNYGAAGGLFSFKLKPSSKHSIEYHLNQYAKNDCSIFSLRNKINQEYLTNNAVNKSRITGAKEKTGDLSKVCDAVFFIKRMQGVNSIR